MAKILITNFTALLTGLLTGFFLVLFLFFAGCYSRTSASGFDSTIALGTPAEKATASNFPCDASSRAITAPVHTEPATPIASQ